MRRLLLAALPLVVSCTDEAPLSSASASASASASPSVSASPSASHTAQLDGHAFPDKVLALTWDDGPDASTLALAWYLESRHISATFFVVSSWSQGLSEDPGAGRGVYESGYEFLPILGDLVALGHRLGNHTLHHVVLREEAGADVVDRELRENQRHLDPFLTNEARFFRVPGGGWGSFAQGIVDHDAYLSRMVGPIRWDIDQKDWDESLHCRGPHGASECERAAPGGALRMKPQVVAARYVASIESAGHGIVLLHDRVGHVGSTYGLEVAEAMIPQLEAKGFVFAAPVLQLSPLRVRDDGAGHDWDPSSVRVGDMNGDGRHDVCGRVAGGGLLCAMSVQNAFSAEDHLQRAGFRLPARHGASKTAAAPLGAMHLADVTGDGQADACVVATAGIMCAASSAAGELGAFRNWTTTGAFSGAAGAAGAALFFADVDGDGRADVCARGASGLSCARNAGQRFDELRVWQAELSDAQGWADRKFASTLQLADVDGDGRADVCGRGPSGVVCALALATGKGFGKVTAWAPAGELATGVLRFGDLNGDGRADACVITREEVSCALATAHGFTRATSWLALSGELAEPVLGDVSGDGRADLCGVAAGGIACALAP